MTIFIIGCTKMDKINFYIKEGQIVKDISVKTLPKRYLEKAKNNLVTMRILSDLNDKKNEKRRLE